MYHCHARGGGGPQDRVGTLIRNKNVESNFLTLGIRFQFKVPHLGEGFEFYVSRVVYKSRQPAKSASFSARFRRLLSLLHESRYVRR